MSYTQKDVEDSVGIPRQELIATLKEEELKEETKEEAEPKEEPKEEPGKPVKQSKKFLIGGMILLVTLLVIYFGIAQYFNTHFYFGTEINGISLSGKTVKDAQAVISAELNDYTLNIKERGGKTEQIKAHELGLQFSSEEELKKIKDCQNGYGWISACFDAKGSKKKVTLKYDAKLLKERINQLSCFQPGNIVEPKNPSFRYVNNSYIIVDGTNGTKVDKDIVYSCVVKSIKNLEPEINLDLMGCYIKPQYDSKSPQIIEVKNTLNKYVATKITYSSGDRRKTLDGSLIHRWLIIDENLRVILNEKKVKEYANELFNMYATVGKTRNFTTASGEIVKIGGGDYGRTINRVKEAQYIISAIKRGLNITKEPFYSQNVFPHGNNDIGNTYVEISLGKQHLWFYKNGSLIVQGDVVTGNVRAHHSTPKGIYRLKYRARNVVLRGPGYAAHVDFWMPFNGGIGIHDASWRSVFGHSIYKTSGSHGCVNAPYHVAKKIFENVASGTPVICY